MVTALTQSSWGLEVAHPSLLDVPHGDPSVDGSWVPRPACPASLFLPGPSGKLAPDPLPREGASSGLQRLSFPRASYLPLERLTEKLGSETTPEPWQPALALCPAGASSDLLAWAGLGRCGRRTHQGSRGPELSKGPLPGTQHPNTLCLAGSCSVSLSGFSSDGHAP